MQKIMLITAGITLEEMITKVVGFMSQMKKMPESEAQKIFTWQTRSNLLRVARYLKETSMFR